MCSLCPANFDLQEWLDQVKEEAIEPGLEIIDPHHHLWDAKNEPRPAHAAAKYFGNWSIGWQENILRMAFPKSAVEFFGIHTPILHRYLSPELQADFGGHNVIKTVYIECGFEDKSVAPEYEQVGETKLIHGLTQKYGYPNYVVCHVNLNLGKAKVAKALKKHQEAHPNVIGLRHQLAAHPDPSIFTFFDSKVGMIKSKKFLDGLSAVAEAGLTFDAFVYHTQLKDLAAVAKKFPEMTIILDHTGTPIQYGKYKNKKEKARKEWEEGMKEVANCPNVYLKLSGLTMPGCGLGFNYQDTPPTSDELCDALEPWFTSAVEYFGIERCMFASNFPVDRVSCSYVVLFNAFKKFCNRKGYSAFEKDLLFKSNAETCYKLK